MKTKHLLQCLLLVTSISIFSCSKDINSSGSSSLQVRLTDAPAGYDQVNVDIREVRVNMSDDSTGWISLNTNAKVYNLLRLQNGVDTLLATGTIRSGTVSEIRLVLGSNNTVVVGGVSYPLTIPSGSESGLKIKLLKPMKSTLETVTIDFDASLSVKSEADGYKLRPVLIIK